MKSINKMSLKNGFIWSTIGNSVYFLCQFLIIVVITKYCGVDETGKFSFANALTNPIMMFMSFALRPVIATDKNKEFTLNNYFQFRFISIILFVVIVLFVSFFVNSDFELWLVVIIIALVKSFEMISDIFYGFFQEKERMDFIAISMILKSCISIILILASVLITKSLIWGCIGYLISRIYPVLNIEMHYMRKIKSDFSFELNIHKHFAELKNIFVLTLPLAFVVSINNLQVNIPRYFIADCNNLSILGIFTVISSFLTVTGLFVNALGQTVSSRLALYYNENIALFIKLIGKMQMFAFSFGLFQIALFYFFGEFFLKIIFSAEVANHVNLLYFLTIYGIFNYMASFLGYSITAMRKFKIQLPLITVVTSTVFLACSIFVPRYGMLGTSYALIISSVVQFIFSLLIVVHGIANRKVNF